MIYVIGTPGSAIVKIGHAASPDERLRTLQTGNPAPLAVLWSHEGDSELEGHLHATFAQYRVRGEWFDLSHVPDAAEAVRQAVASIGCDLLPRPRREIGPRREGANEARRPGGTDTGEVWRFVRELDNRFPGRSVTVRQAALEINQTVEDVERQMEEAVSRKLLVRRNQDAPGGEALYSSPIDAYFYPGELG
ncbi:GIY-YIG nuclease family protein [Streptomyces hydrogenans]|uniref:GIY-YIG nuclease family protein n=1 Tax=Streptomyces TaxID=1883 RepID=UPI003644C5C6